MSGFHILSNRKQDQPDSQKAANWFLLKFPVPREQDDIMEPPTGERVALREYLKKVDT